MMRPDENHSGKNVYAKHSRNSKFGKDGFNRRLRRKVKIAAKRRFLEDK